MARCYLATGLTCAGGTRAQALTLLTGSTVTRTLDHRDEFAAVLVASEAAALANGAVLELIEDSGVSSEWIVRRVNLGFGVATGTVWCDAVASLLSTTPPVRVTSSGRVVTQINASLTPLQWITGYVLTNLATDGLPWLSVGTVEPQDVVTLALDAVSRMGLLTALEQATGATWLLTRVASAGYVLNLYATVPGVAIDAVLGDDIPSLVEDADVTESGTNLVVLGADDGGGRATLSDAAFTVVTSGGQYSLKDPSTLAQAFQVVDQAKGMRLIDDQGNLSGAITSNTAAGLITGSLGSIANGATVQVYADASLTPLIGLTHPARAAAFGLRTRIERLSYGRQRTLIPDPSTLLTGTWSDYNTSGRTVIPRSELGVTRIGAVNGARAAATGTGTPFTVNGLPASTLVYTGDRFNIAGATYTLTADAIPDASGNIALAITPALAVNYNDNDPVTWIRQENRTVTTSALVSKYAPRIPLSAPGDGGLIPGSGYNTGLAGPLVGPGYLSQEQIAVDYSLCAGYADGTFQLAGGAIAIDKDTIALTDNGTFSGSITTATVIRIAAYNDRTGQNWEGFRFVSRTGTVSTWTRLSSAAGGSGTLANMLLMNWLDFSLVGGGYVAVAWTNQTWASGASFGYGRLLDTRLLRINGAQTAGSSTMTLRGLSAVFTRNWSGSDTLSLRYAIGSQTLDTTAGAITADPIAKYDFALTTSLTFNTGTSTIQTLQATDYAGGVALFPLALSDGSVRLWAVVSISGSTITLTTRVTGFVPGATVLAQTVTCAGWALIDTYSVTATAAWGSNARATLTVVIPSYRSYPRGAPVWANWHGGGALGAASLQATCLRLNAAVAASASSAVVFGDDAYTTAWDGSSALLVGCYRFFANGPTGVVAGDTVYAASNATADGTGAVSLTLTAANTNALANGATVTIARPAIIPSVDPTTGYVVRLRYAVGGGTGIPTTTTPAAESAVFTVRVATGQTRVVTVWARFAVSTPQTLYANTGPCLALLSADGATIVGSTQLTANTAFTTGVNVITQQITTTISATTSFKLRVYGGSSSDSANWCVLLSANAYADSNATLPIMPQPLANAGWFYAQRALAVRSLPLQTVALTRYQASVPDGTFARAWDSLAVIGSTLTIRAWGLVAQVASLRTDLLTPSRSTVIVSTDAQRATAALARLAASVNTPSSAVASVGTVTTSVTAVF